MTENDKGFLN